MKELIGLVVTTVLMLSTIAGLLAAWITHIVVCIQTGAYLLLIAGAFIAPVGMVHGIMIWFNLI